MDVVMSIYIVEEYSVSYSNKSGSLRQYYGHKPNNDMPNSDWVISKAKITWISPNEAHAMDIERKKHCH